MELTNTKSSNWKGFRFKNCGENGHFKLHHTIEENGLKKRIRFKQIDFSVNHFVAVDHRGNVFVFDFENEIYQTLLDRIPKCSFVKFSPYNRKQIVFGFKDGVLSLIEFDDAGGSSVKIKVQHSNSPITNVAFPITNTNHYFLSTSKSGTARIHDFGTFEELQRICLPAVKAASFWPQFDNIIVGICEDDSLRIWGSESFELFRSYNILEMRNEFLKRNKLIKLTVNLKPISSNENIIKSLKMDVKVAGGMLTSFSCSKDTHHLVVSTVTGQLINFQTNDGNFEIIKVIKFANNIYAKHIEFVLSEMENASILLCLTDLDDLLIIDLDQAGTNMISQFIITANNCHNFAFPDNYKMLAVTLTTGEIELISMQFVLERMEQEANRRHVIKYERSRNNCAEETTVEHEKVKLMLPVKRLIGILQEYDEYPEKYRQLIWKSLLRLPGNVDAFCELLRKGYHPCVKDYERLFPLKNKTALRNLKKIVSCLAHYSPVFGQCDFIPHFVFPFLKLNDKNLLFTFEVCMTLLLNQGQLFFEFSPLKPYNYLGLIENLLAYYDAELMQFYIVKEIKSSTFAWELIYSAFAEVLDANQWLLLWDHMVTNAPKFLVFCVLGYNLYQKPVIMQLEDRKLIEQFFRDQNLIDLRRFLKIAYKLMDRCPSTLDPARYLKAFQPLLHPIYQKFYNYPRLLADRVESERMTKQRELKVLEEQMDTVNQLENRLTSKLDECLKSEEHKKRMQKVERVIEEAIIHEEERVANHRQLVLLYERELRDKQLETLIETKECERRDHVLDREKELDNILRATERNRIRDQVELNLVEERHREHDLERRAVD